MHPYYQKSRKQDRQILDGVFYQWKNGCNWGDLQKDLPPYSTVFWHYKHWRSQGENAQMLTTLPSQVRIDAPKKTAVDAIADRRRASCKEYLQCWCETLKGFALTNALMALSAIWRWIA